MINQFEIYAGGRFVQSDYPVTIFNPYNGKAVGDTWLASPQILEEAILKAQSAREAMKNLPSFVKSRILNSIADQLESKIENFTGILCRESGKPWKYARGEVQRAIQVFRVAAEESKRLPGEYISIDWTEAGAGKEGIVGYFPIGLVAGISPFNFPLNLAVHKIAPAIATGCPIILKPSSNTPLSTLELAKIIDQSELPPGAVSILPMDRKTGNLMVTDERFKLLSFTGSPEVGWKMKNDAGKKKVILELGGNAGVIVSNSADLEKAVTKCVSGGFAYSGQVCIHTQRIYVQEDAFERFADMFVEQTLKLKAGDPEDPETDVSVMIDEENATRVESWVQEALDNGAVLLCGGKRKAAFFEPTVLTNTRFDMKVCSLEIFGPVVVLEKYRSFGDAVHEINKGRFGLQTGVFTNRIDEMNMAFHDLVVGGVIINDVPTFRVDHMPYGGVKDSGLGREGVKYAMMDMLEPKILVKDKL